MGVAAAALAVLGVVGCSDTPPQPDAADMTVTVCLPGDPDSPQAGVRSVEVRRGSQVLGSGTGSAGTIFDFFVPAGDVEVYLDEEFLFSGSADPGSAVARPCPSSAPSPTPT
ncbi:hypothetical protein [uncultured Pseudokineococcus sp.]|uniref:hypothetical protein n=1 Tax=uncultured Pseudokineococcus sp. TaxID=1642928 RepID=UPI00261E20B1|nr:hypothetical protein [uncultured Pseudokineococcus sp.]